MCPQEELEAGAYAARHGYPWDVLLFPVYGTGIALGVATVMGLFRGITLAEFLILSVGFPVSGLLLGVIRDRGRLRLFAIVIGVLFTGIGCFFNLVALNGMSR